MTKFEEVVDLKTCAICEKKPGECECGFMETIDSALPIFEFSKNDPPDGEWFAFVCPVEKDRWEVGWRDWYKIRVEGGPSYKPEELTYWTPLPQIPKEQS